MAMPTKELKEAYVDAKKPPKHGKKRGKTFDAHDGAAALADRLKPATLSRIGY